MTLVEALAHIQSVEKCHSVAAQVHLKREIGDGVIPVKWADSKGPKDKPNLANYSARNSFFQAMVLLQADYRFAPC